MTMPTRERVVRPSDCALLVAVPTDFGSFQRRLAWPSGYVATLARESGWSTRAARPAWHIYERQVAGPVLRAIDRARARGTTVCMHALERDLTTMSSSRAVVTLFAHCEAGAGEADHHGTVEFDDGPVDIGDVAQRIAPDFSGVVDLALCESWRLGEVIKAARSRCLVVMNVAKVTPAFRASFYAATVDLIARTPQRYTDVTLSLAKELSKWSGPREAAK